MPPRRLKTPPRSLYKLADSRRLCRTKYGKSGGSVSFSVSFNGSGKRAHNHKRLDSGKTVTSVHDALPVKLKDIHVFCANTNKDKMASGGRSCEKRCDLTPTKRSRCGTGRERTPGVVRSASSSKLQASLDGPIRITFRPAGTDVHGDSHVAQTGRNQQLDTANTNEKGPKAKPHDITDRSAKTKVHDVTDRGAKTKVHDANDKGAKAKVHDVNDRGAKTKVHDVNDRGAKTKVHDANDKGAKTKAIPHNADKDKASRRIAEQRAIILVNLRQATDLCRRYAKLTTLDPPPAAPAARTTNTNSNSMAPNHGRDATLGGGTMKRRRSGQSRHTSGASTSRPDSCPLLIKSSMRVRRCRSCAKHVRFSLPGKPTGGSRRCARQPRCASLPPGGGASFTAHRHGSR